MLSKISNLDECQLDVCAFTFKQDTTMHTDLFDRITRGQRILERS